MDESADMFVGSKHVFAMEAIALFLCMVVSRVVLALCLLLTIVLFRSTENTRLESRLPQKSGKANCKLSSLTAQSDLRTSCSQLCCALMAEHLALWNDSASKHCDNPIKDRLHGTVHPLSDPAGR